MFMNREKLKPSPLAVVASEELAKITGGYDDDNWCGNGRIYRWPPIPQPTGNLLTNVVSPVSFVQGLTGLAQPSLG
jgi:hypothetical protein